MGRFSCPLLLLLVYYTIKINDIPNDIQLNERITENKMSLLTAHHFYRVIKFEAA